MAITYNITTNFGAKDTLPSGDSNKIIRGSEFTTEFTNIKTAFTLAAPVASPTFTGTATIPTAAVTAFSGNPSFTGNVTFAGIIEGTATDTTGGSYTITGADTIIKFDVTTALTLSSSLTDGESVTVMFNSTSTITWPTLKWSGGSAPTVNTGLTSGQYQVVQLWNVGGALFAVYSGEFT